MYRPHTIFSVVFLRALRVVVGPLCGKAAKRLIGSHDNMDRTPAKAQRSEGHKKKIELFILLRALRAFVGLLVDHHFFVHFAALCLRGTPWRETL